MTFGRKSRKWNGLSNKILLLFAIICGVLSDFDPSFLYLQNEIIKKNEINESFYISDKYYVTKYNVSCAFILFGNPRFHGIFCFVRCFVSGNFS